MPRSQPVSDLKRRYQQLKHLYRKRGIDLRNYQLKGIRWMLNLEAKGLSGILADEPGLGKTYQSLAVAISSPGPTLVIVPSSILFQWYDDAKLLLPTPYQVYLHHGGYRRHSLPDKTRIVITTPTTLLKSGERVYHANLKEIAWTRVIFDEAHLMKNPLSKISQCVKLLQARYKWALTGTPVQNRTIETENLFRYVLQVGDRQPIQLEPVIERHLLRRTKKECLQLPPIDIQTIQMDFLTPGEREMYHMIRKDVKQEFMEMIDGNHSVQQMMACMFELLLRMRQTSIHPQLVVDGYRKKYGQRDIMTTSFNRHLQDMGTHSTKHLTLLDEVAKHPHDSTIVFSQFTGEIDILEKAFRKKGLQTRRITGGQPNRPQIIQDCQTNSLSFHHLQDSLTPNKQTNPLTSLPNHLLQHIASFVPHIDLVFIQIKAGGVGLNLQKFNRIYFTSPDWNPTNEIQAIARAHRFGQEKKVYVKHIILEDSQNPGNLIDQRILDIQEQKRQLAATLLGDPSLLQNGSITHKGLTHRDFTRLLS